MNRILALAPFALLLAACGAEPAAAPLSAPQAPGAAPAPASSLLLKEDIPGTVPVLEALKGSEGQEVAIFGKLQRKQPGRAIFYLTDESVLDCGRCGMPGGCKTPWDYCCHPKEMKAATIVVELRGADGLPLQVESLGLRELDLVAVKGTLAKGAGDRLMLLAKGGWFLRDRPTLPDTLKWPK